MPLARIFHDGRAGSPLPAAGYQPALAFCHVRRAEDCAPYHGSLHAFRAAHEISGLGFRTVIRRSQGCWSRRSKAAALSAPYTELAGRERPLGVTQTSGLLCRRLPVCVPSDEAPRRRKNRSA